MWLKPYRNYYLAGLLFYAKVYSSFLNFAWWLPLLLENSNWLHEEQDGHRQEKWEGKQKGKSDTRVTESKARQKESTTLCTNLAD
jgi:hypothetical protein